MRLYVCNTHLENVLDGKVPVIKVRKTTSYLRINLTKDERDL